MPCFKYGERSKSQDSAFNSITYYLLISNVVSVLCRTAEQDAEMMRLQILGDPNLMQQLQQVMKLRTTYIPSTVY